MKTPDLKRVIEQGGVEITRLNAHIHETVRFRDASLRQRDEWKNACAEFHSRYGALAFPGGYAGAVGPFLASRWNACKALSSVRPFGEKRGCARMRPDPSYMDSPKRKRLRGAGWSLR